MPRALLQKTNKAREKRTAQKKSSFSPDSAHSITLWAGAVGFAVFTICLIYSIADYNFDESFPDCSFLVFFVSFAVFAAEIGASIVLSLCKKN